MKTFDDFLKEYGFNEVAGDQLKRAVVSWLKHRLPPDTMIYGVDDGLKSFEAYLLAPKESYIRRLQADHEQRKQDLFARINELTTEIEDLKKEAERRESRLEEIRANRDESIARGWKTCLVCDLPEKNILIGKNWYCWPCIEKLSTARERPPLPMLLTCPACSARHIDKGEFATKPHHTHACQSCGMCWRPSVEPTVGVQFLPGFKDEP